VEKHSLLRRRPDPFVTVNGYEVTSMSLLKKLAEKLSANESGELKKIRVEAEKRRSAKSSASLPKVDGDPLDRTISTLNSRIYGKPD